MTTTVTVPVTVTLPVPLKAAAQTLINPSFSRTFSPPKRRVLTFSRRRSNVRMSAATQAQAQAQGQGQGQAVIEHIVLLKVNDNANPSKVNKMVNGLNGMNSIDLILHVTAGPLLRTRSSPFAFTHLLHSRYRTKEDLASYRPHPTHVSVAEQFVYPNCDDIMAVDWVQGELTGPVGLSPGSAIRATFLKLKENVGEAAKGEILEVLKGRFGEVGQISVGENFSPERAKGYSIASLAVFKGVSEMEEAVAVAVDLDLDKVRDYVEGVIDLDYVVAQLSEHPLFQSANSTVLL